MDLYSRNLVGWALDSTMTEELVTDALAMAFNRRVIETGLIIHSDRGVEYRSQKYLDFLRGNGAIPSMSRKGNCWDNAPMEWFFSRLKVELIYADKYKTVAESKSAIFEYIEVFYNRLRRHSALGYVSPTEFERNAATAAELECLLFMGNTITIQGGYNSWGTRDS
jgi:transposase InsO family protein